MILIVEDDVDFREALGEHLRAAGFELLFASNGAEALAALAAVARIELILLDLRMPVMDGYEFLARFAETRLARRVPVVVMTAEFDARGVERFDCVLDVLRKPFEPLRLEAAIGEHLPPFRATRA